MAFMTFHSVGNVIGPQLTNIFQRGKYTTNEYPTEIHPLLIFHPNKLGKGFRLIVAFAGRPHLFKGGPGSFRTG